MGNVFQDGAEIPVKGWGRNFAAHQYYCQVGFRRRTESLQRIMNSL